MASPLDDLFGASPNYGAISRKSEKKRQHIIDLGMKQLGAVYGGGSAPFYSLANADGAKFDSKGNYYSLGSKNGFGQYWGPKPIKQPSSFQRSTEIAGSVVPGDITGDVLQGARTGDWGKAATNIGINAATGGAYGVASKVFGRKPPSPREIAAKKFRRGQLFSAPTNQSFEGFQPEFFRQREKAYTDFALPQLGDQYRTNNAALTYGMSNRGLTGGSVDQEARFGLEKIMGQGRQQIADTGIQQANQLRTDIEGSRQQATQQLYQTGDPTQATQSAISAAAGFQRPSTYTPLANMFSNLANQYYANQLLNNYQKQPTGNSYSGGNPNNFARIS